MILDATIAGTQIYIDTNDILYAYESSGNLQLVIASDAVQSNPNLELYTNASPNEATAPSYADFVTATANHRFIEVSHATLTNVCVNLNRIARLAAIDSSNTTILFDKYNVVKSDTALSSLRANINSEIAIYRDADVDIVSDGTGVVTLPNDYISGSWKVFLRGTLVQRSSVSETAANKLTIAGSTRVGDFINVTYKY